LQLIVAAVADEPVTVIMPARAGVIIQNAAKNRITKLLIGPPTIHAQTASNRGQADCRNYGIEGMQDVTVLLSAWSQCDRAALIAGCR
jgi:hypothetical protein